MGDAANLTTLPPRNLRTAKKTLRKKPKSIRNGVTKLGHIAMMVKWSYNIICNKVFKPCLSYGYSPNHMRIN